WPAGWRRRRRTRACLLLAWAGAALGPSRPHTWRPQGQGARWLRRRVLRPPAPPYGHVCQVGDPTLRARAAPVEPARVRGAEVQALIRALVRAMRRHGCVALSAPQVGVPLRVFVAEYPERLCAELPARERQARQVAPFPLRVFVNPAMRVLDARLVSFPEGCQSVSGFSACVARYQAVQVSGLDADGEPTTWQASGWAARIIQHEMDHLEGVLYIDKMESRTFLNLRWAELNE
uniref:Peptide deformylase n=1 Tax=Varanus komodoensis TaxID=61221 RepID=A0A8D2J923_VARKO